MGAKGWPSDSLLLVAAFVSEPYSILALTNGVGLGFRTLALSYSIV